MKVDRHIAYFSRSAKALEYFVLWKEISFDVEIGHQKCKSGWFQKSLIRKLSETTDFWLLYLSIARCNSISETGGLRALSSIHCIQSPYRLQAQVSMLTTNEKRNHKMQPVIKQATSKESHQALYRDKPCENKGLRRVAGRENLRYLFENKRGQEVFQIQTNRNRHEKTCHRNAW